MDFIKSKPKETDKGNWISVNRINVTRLGITYDIDIELATETYKIHILTPETIDTINEIINSSKHVLIPPPPKEDLQKYYNKKYNDIYVRYFYYDFDKEKYKIRLNERIPF